MNKLKEMLEIAEIEDYQAQIKRFYESFGIREALEMIKEMDKEINQLNEAINILNYENSKP